MTDNAIAAEPQDHGLSIGSDIGGTFTDTVIVTADGASFAGKALTTHDDLKQGVLASIDEAAKGMGLTRRQVLERASLLSHGTTVGLNALLTRSGAKVGLITTAGFESTLAMARSNKVHGLPEADRVDALRWRKPDLVVPRRRTIGVRERIDASGAVVVPLDEAGARAALGALAAEGVEALAIATLWSPANPVHELRLGELAGEVLPGVSVTLSHRIAPRIGEYERTITAVLNAYVAPLVSDYLHQLEVAIRSEGFDGRFLVMTMGGGVRPAARMVQAPVHMLQSGPVGGITASRELGRKFGHANVIATDVGGTSFDVGLVVDGELPRAMRPRVNRHGLAIPVIDIASIGTGGGSIAHVDEVLGALRVGPESAGSNPGPACYGRGGMRPTLTDAAVVLGHIDRLGALALDRDAACAAVRHIAEPLGLSLEAAAEGIVDVACAQMADLVRRATIQRGHDPRRFHLYAYGGAAPQYVGRYAAELGVRGVVIPRLGPEFSAWGAVCSDLVMLREMDVPPRAFAPPLEDLARHFETLEDGAVADLAGLGAAVTVERRVGLRFANQIHRLDVPLPPGPIDRSAVAHAAARFRQAYERIVGRGASGGGTAMELVALSVEARISASLPEPDLAGEFRTVAPVRRRRAWFGGCEWDVPCFALSGLAPDRPIDGPAFLESEQTTVVVHPGTRAEPDRAGNVLIGLIRTDNVVSLRAGGGR